MSSSVDQALFERLLRPHMTRLYGIAWRLAGNKADAEDLFQDLLIKAYGKLDTLADIEEPLPWLSRVLYNLFVDRHRSLKRQRLRIATEGELPGGSIDDMPGIDDPERDQQRFEQLRKLDAALGKLSDEHRLVVLLHDTDGYKLAEIQELTGIPTGTIKSRLHRARARLREILTEDGTIS